MENKTPKPKVDVYRTTPTFTLPLRLLEEFEVNLTKSIEANRLMLMSDGRTLEWVKEMIVKEKKANPENKKPEQ